jgi:hypothetical protein
MTAKADFFNRKVQTMPIPGVSIANSSRRPRPSPEFLIQALAKGIQKQDTCFSDLVNPLINNN